MSDSKDDDDFKKIMEHAEVGLATQGVAAVTVKDGTFFFLSRGTVDNLVSQMDQSKQDRCIVFVKHGGPLMRKN